MANKKLLKELKNAVIPEIAPDENLGFQHPWIREKLKALSTDTDECHALIVGLLEKLKTISRVRIPTSCLSFPLDLSFSSSLYLSFLYHHILIDEYQTFCA